MSAKLETEGAPCGLHHKHWVPDHINPTHFTASDSCPRSQHPLPVPAKSVHPVPAVEIGSSQEAWTKSPLLSTFCIWEEKQVWGRLPGAERPSEGCEAINKRFVVNNLVNTSAGCSFLSLT